MAIAQTIHGEGLEVFYARRAQSSDKPSAYLASDQIPAKLLPYDDPSLLGRFTRPVGDEGDLETTLRLEKIRCAAVFGYANNTCAVALECKTYKLITSRKR